jgi:hypothetical protein
MPDLVTAKDLLVGIAAALAAGLSIWTFLQSPAKKNAEELAKFIAEIFGPFRKAVGEDIKFLDTAIDDTKARVTSMEAIITQLPDKDSIHRLALQLEQMNTKIAGMAATSEATQRTAGRVEQFLLEQGRK